MPRYNVRDRIGHWVKPRSAEGQHCQHACCRGYREHPKHLPVILPNKTLHRMSDEELASHFDRVSEGSTKEEAKSRDQILHEFERRDRAADRRRATEQRRQERWAKRKEATSAARAARQMEQDAERERVFLQAEEYSRGNWVNRAGARAGITEREILYGPERTFNKYASEEVREYFSTRRRPTRAYFRQQTAESLGASWWS